MEPDANTENTFRVKTPFLLLTAVTCGALIMVIEVLGSRVIGPFFGVSLFVWTSLITVALVALALGYAAGGFLADHKESPDVMYGLILLAGLYTLCIPWLSEPTLRSMMPLGIRLGALSSATVLFGPPLLLLGCVSPYLVKIGTRQFRHIGRTVGSFYALSTIGSVAGTVLTGFVLIAYLGVSRIFLLTGTLLILLAAVYFVGLRKKWVYLLSLLVPATLFGLHRDGPATAFTNHGLQVEVIAEKDSYYGSLKVVDKTINSAHYRIMLIDGLTQSKVNLTTGRSLFDYSHFLQHIPRALNPEGQRCLVLGLGAGLIPAWYEQQGVDTHVVDIDPEIVRLAQEYFGYKGKNPVRVEDARYALMTNEQPFDFLLLDVANGDAMPGHLFSREAFELYERNITKQGVLGVNLIGNIGEDAKMTASVARTMAERFDQVEIYPTFDVHADIGDGNLILVAYNGPQRDIDWQELRGRPFAKKLSYDARQQLGVRFEFPPHTDAIILTDDYNPIEFYNMRMTERLRRDIVRYTEWEVLL